MKTKTQTRPRFSYVQFCDDIRMEIGNKISLMGLYNGQMLFTAFPALIPRLGINLVVDSPIDAPVKELIVKITNGAEVIFEMAQKPLISDTAAKASEAGDLEFTRSLINMHTIVQGLPIVAPCTLSVITTIDNEKSIVGKLRVDLAPQSLTTTTT